MRLRRFDRFTDRFTLLELLVVVAIIAVLAAILLPSLNNARDRAKFTTCGTQQKQVYAYAEMFRGDHQALLPAWYFTNRPNGPTQADRDAQTSGIPNLGGKAVHFGWLLIHQGYMSESNVAVDLTGVSGTANVRAKVAREDTNSILRCPNGYPEQGPDAFKTMNQNLADGDRRRLLTIQRDRNPANLALLPKGYLTNFYINMDAGSYQYYHNRSVNHGFFPRKRWAGTDTSRIGYIFEHNHNHVDPNHFKNDYSRTVNNWHRGNVGFPVYNPGTPHIGNTRSNLVYADGHLDYLNHDYTGQSFPFSWY